MATERPFDKIVDTIFVSLSRFQRGGHITRQEVGELGRNINDLIVRANSYRSDLSTINQAWAIATDPYSNGRERKEAEAVIRITLNYRRDAYPASWDD